jgi:hypothetical protein
MPGLGRDVVWQIAERECFRLHFQVDLRVNVRGFQGDMPEPRPDGIDVHAGTPEKTMPHIIVKLWPVSVGRHRRNQTTGLGREALYTGNP